MSAMTVASRSALRNTRVRSPMRFLIASATVSARPFPFGSSP